MEGPVAVFLPGLGSISPGPVFFISLGMRKPVWESCGPGVLEAASTTQKLFARAPDTFEPNLKLVLVLIYFLLIPHLPKGLEGARSFLP